MNHPHQIRTVKCAHCGAVRQGPNHWFVIAITGGRFRCAPFGATAGSGAGTRGNAGRPLRKGEQPVCGRQCAQKIFERYLGQERLIRARRVPEQGTASACEPPAFPAGRVNDRPFAREGSS
jgi:hypothetical protein